MKHSIILSQSELQQTVIVKRIPIKPQPDKEHKYPLWYVISGGKQDGYFRWGTHEYGMSIQYAKPPYQPGQVAYVKETWCKMSDVPCFHEYRDEKNHYVSAYEYGYKEGSKHPDPNIRWRSASTMPKEAARIWLKVLEVKAVFDGLWYWEVTMERTEAI